MTTDLNHSGPIDYLVVEFPGDKRTGEGFPLLLDLVDRGTIRVLDLVFVRTDHAGGSTVVTLDKLATGDVDLSEFAGASSGLLSADDVAAAATVLDPNCTAGILVYENTWAAPFAQALRLGGGRLVASGRIPVQAILAELDAQDAAGE